MKDPSGVVGGGAGDIPVTDQPRAEHSPTVPPLEEVLARQRTRGEIPVVPPEKVGGYQIIDVIGRGGMGVVYVAVHPTLDRKVALKLIRPDRAADPEFGRQFLKEGRALARIKSPHVVQVYDAAVDERYGLFLVMELVSGESLKEKFLPGQPVPERDAIILARDLARGIAAAHGSGITHGDVSPNNVLVEPSGGRGPGFAKLTDFGLAGFVGDDSVGIGRGTPGYRSPEQVSGSVSFTHTSDVYSLGAVLYRMLTGQLAFADQPILFPSERKLPRPLRGLCQDCLAVNPVTRPSATDVAARLEKYRTRWQKRLTALAVAIGFVILTVLAWRVHRSNRDEVEARQNELKARETAQEARRELSRQQTIELVRLVGQAKFETRVLYRTPKDRLAEKRLNDIRRWISDSKSRMGTLERPEAIEVMIAELELADLEGKWQEVTAALTDSVLQEAEAAGLGAEAHASLGGALFHLGDRPKATYHFERAVSFQPNDEWLRLKYAVALLLTGRADPATKELTRVIEATTTKSQDPASRELLAAACYIRGTAFTYRLGEPDRGFVDFDRSADLMQPDEYLGKQLYTEALRGRAMSGMLSADPARSVQTVRDFTVVIASDRQLVEAGDNKAVYSLAEALCNLASLVAPEEGLKHCDDALALLGRAKVPPDDNWAFVWTTRGAIMGMFKGRESDAIADLQKAQSLLLTLQPSPDLDRNEERARHLSITSINLCKLFVRQDLTRAEKEIEKAIETLGKLFGANRAKYLSLWLDAHFSRGLVRLGIARQAAKKPEGKATETYAAAADDFSLVIREINPTIGDKDNRQSVLLLKAHSMRLVANDLRGSQGEAMEDAEHVLALSDKYLKGRPEAASLAVDLARTSLYLARGLARRNPQANARRIGDMYSRLIGAGQKPDGLSAGDCELFAQAFAHLGEREPAVSLQTKAWEKAKGTDQEVRQLEILERYRELGKGEVPPPSDPTPRRPR